MKSERNRTITINNEEINELNKYINKIDDINNTFNFINKVINGNTIEIIKYIPDNFADLIIIDPPYNLSKNYNGYNFHSMKRNEYIDYVNQWLPIVCRKLKDNGTLYICCDWKCTSEIYECLSKELTIINRITWQREKGRGSKNNWKNGMEDIWMAVKNPKNYTFNVNSVKIRRKVVAPYKINGEAKDWEKTIDGNFRDTYPSNFWDDISIPFWSMPENTEHPTQKPEKLIAKLILASSNENDIVFDPFLGSGTTCVTAKKLNRKYCGIELNEKYCQYSIKRLLDANENKIIQGYNDGIFWERNTLVQQKKMKK